MISGLCRVNTPFLITFILVGIPNIKISYTFNNCLFSYYVKTVLSFLFHSCIFVFYVFTNPYLIYFRYIELNRKSYTQANELKVLYGDQLPTCLVNKPAGVIVHVLDQIKSTEATVYQVSHFSVLVPSESIFLLKFENFRKKGLIFK